MMRKLNAEISSKVNRSLVLSEIHHHPLISRAELAEKSGLDRSAITHILNFLIQEELVEEVCKGDASSRGGRRPILLRVREKARHLIAVEVGIAQVSGLVADLQGEPQYRHREPISRGQSPIEAMSHLIDRLLEDYPAARENLAVIGISSPGIINNEKGTISLNMYHRWRDVEVSDILSERYKVPVFLENDANAAALGEMHVLQREEDVSSLVYLFIRESLPGSEFPLGVGGALILRGQLWRGASFCSGEVSKSINENFSNTMASLTRKKPELSGATLSDVTIRAERGEKEAQEVVTKLAESTGDLLGHVATFIDPEALLLYIHPPEHKDYLIKTIEEVFQRDIESEFRPSIQLLRPRLAEEATLMGIIHVALTKVFIEEPTTSSILIQ